jgi:hypothetical protein
MISGQKPPRDGGVVVFASYGTAFRNNVGLISGDEEPRRTGHELMGDGEKAVEGCPSLDRLTLRVTLTSW